MKHANLDLFDSTSRLMTRRPEPPTGAQLAERGAAAAARSAERVHPGWGELAYETLVAFARSRDRFMVEDLRAHATEAGLPPPPDSRAWGLVVRRAMRAGIIRRIGYEPGRNPACHGRPTAVWSAS